MPNVFECQHIWMMDRIIHEMGYPFITVAHHCDKLGYRYDERVICRSYR